jgi:hypothetical protein
LAFPRPSVIKASDKPSPKSPTSGDACEVTYAGSLKDGTPFDAGTTSFAPNQVIAGWTEAMQLMCEAGGCCTRQLAWGLVIAQVESSRPVALPKHLVYDR